MSFRYPGAWIEDGAFNPLTAPTPIYSPSTLWSWGYNAFGQLGLGNTTQYQFPTLSATGVSAVYGTYGNTGQYGYDGNRLYILKTDGFIYGTGYNGNGQLGIGNTTNPITSWTKITTFTSGQEIGRAHV